MTDIFQSWKDNRFVIAGKELTDDECLVILTDISYWSKHMDTLSAWCNDRDAVTAGMTVTFGSERTLMEFVLKWS
jgi:hypothetical protein